jgi:N-acyl-D-amino-acid deacylase
MDAGALGFSTSQGSVDNGAYGKPVPSRLASRSELLRLMDQMANAGHGIVQLLPRNTRDVEAACEELSELVGRSGRTVTFSAVLTGMFGPRGAAVAALDRFGQVGEGRLVPQMACRPIVQQVALQDPFFLTMFSEAFVDILGEQPQARAAMYSSPEWRQRAHAESLPMMARLGEAFVSETSLHSELVGRRLGDLAAERATTPLDLLIDLSLKERLDTRFTVPLVNDDEEEVVALLNDPRCLLALSDAGAHQSQICDAVFSTYLLSHFVRERQAIPLEMAVWRLSGHQAEVLGLTDRGIIRAGAAADLVAFDPDTVGTSPLERVRDLPGGADRLLGRGEGIHHVWINGTRTVDSGIDTDERPGLLIRQ